MILQDVSVTGNWDEILVVIPKAHQFFYRGLQAMFAPRKYESSCCVK
jgi:hypothetical protein